MKWLREISTQYIPGVEFDGENVNFQNNNISWDEDYFTILPLTDGKLTIRAYDPGRLISGTAASPQNEITVDWRPKSSDPTSAWTQLLFKGGGLNFFQGYILKTVTLTAGSPVELKCSTGLAKVVTPSLGEATIYPGSISTNCPAIIMGQLESLAVGDISTSGTPGDMSNPTRTVPWIYYLNGLKELFNGWTTLINASNLVMPSIFQSSSAQPDLTGLFSGCSSLVSSPKIAHGGIYTRCFENCVSLRSVYAKLQPNARVEYTLTDWLKGTHTGNRTIYVPETLDSEYDLCLPVDPGNLVGTKAWTREIFEF